MNFKTYDFASFCLFLTCTMNSNAYSQLDETSSYFRDRTDPNSARDLQLLKDELNRAIDTKGAINPIGGFLQRNAEQASLGEPAPNKMITGLPEKDDKKADQRPSLDAKTKQLQLSPSSGNTKTTTIGILPGPRYSIVQQASPQIRKIIADDFRPARDITASELQTTPYPVTFASATNPSQSAPSGYLSRYQEIPYGSVPSQPIPTPTPLPPVYPGGPIYPNPGNPGASATPVMPNSGPPTYVAPIYGTPAPIIMPGPIANPQSMPPPQFNTAPPMGVPPGMNIAPPRSPADASTSPVLPYSGSPTYGAPIYGTPAPMTMPGTMAPPPSMQSPQYNTAPPIGVPPGMNTAPPRSPSDGVMPRYTQPSPMVNGPPFVSGPPCRSDARYMVSPSVYRQSLDPCGQPARGAPGGRAQTPYATGASPFSYAPPTAMPYNAGYVSSYRPLIGFGQPLGTPGRGIIGQPTAYSKGQPIRNFFRYIFP